MTDINRIWLLGLAMLTVFGIAACSDAEKKALRDLVKDITTNAPETEAAGRALQAISVLEQAEGLSETRRCRAARDIYCAMFQMARDGCNDGTSFCDEVQKALYGGSFPVGGFSICVAAAEDRCQSDLLGHVPQLSRVCRELRQQGC